MTSHQHVIYGLYLPDQVDVILYAGSWCAATVDERLRQHHAGECRTTTKMAAKQGIDPKHLRMRILVYWTSGVELSPEGKIIFALQAQGQSRWNSPHAFSTEDSRRGARKLNETWGKSAAAHEMHVRNGHLFARRTNQTWGKTPEAHQAEARGARKQREIWGQTPEAHKAFARNGRLANCVRHHAGRPKVDRLCAECAAKVKP